MKALVKRVYDIIDLCWLSFSAKVGNSLIQINKEASMQLQLAYLLKNTCDLSIYNEDESVRIELETRIVVEGKVKMCDILLHIKKGEKEVLLPIELKCYKTISSSGGPRGAQDIFRCELYKDLELLESYERHNENTVLGVQLTMTDSRNFIYPKSKNFKSWKYDTSHNTLIKDGILIDTPIGGKPVNMILHKTYLFNWTQVGDYYFLKLQGK
ncbi:hypothetical protein [Gillisia sp. Hel_I_29]|uniref:hypothetical protein n=1 Tax=Gillisia sp. Hel_I_29 TaxID=1249975 RepID=UPI00068A2934|nr:hypothetical protein [Gillisia sp. Hel_I_29]